MIKRWEVIKRKDLFIGKLLLLKMFSTTIMNARNQNPFNNWEKVNIISTDDYKLNDHQENDTKETGKIIQVDEKIVAKKTSIKKYYLGGFGGINISNLGHDSTSVGEYNEYKFKIGETYGITLEYILKKYFSLYSFFRFSHQGGKIIENYTGKYIPGNYIESKLYLKYLELSLGIKLNVSHLLSEGRFQSLSLIMTHSISLLIKDHLKEKINGNLPEQKNSDLTLPPYKKFRDQVKNPWQLGGLLGLKLNFTFGLFIVCAFHIFYTKYLNKLKMAKYLDGLSEEQITNLIEKRIGYPANIDRKEHINQIKETSKLSKQCLFKIAIGYRFAL